MLLATFKQPEAVRRVVNTLDKQQRQLLATLVLAGGSLNDEDLRGLFERFNFGTAETLQHILLALQGKGLLFRTQENNALRERPGLSRLSTSLLDIVWYVPEDVRAALRVTMPTTAYDVERVREGGTEAPTIQYGEPYSFLADLLLIGRALNGIRLEANEETENGRVLKDTVRSGVFARQTGSRSDNEMGIALPAPADRPSISLLETIQLAVPRSLDNIHFAIRLLRSAAILRREDALRESSLYLLPDAADTLLGSASASIARSLFELWLTGFTTDELYDLQEEGIRVRYRAMPLNVSAMRPGELETENAEARQTLLQLIGKVPLNSWISFSAFVRFIYRLNPFFLQKRQRAYPSPHWWMELENGTMLQVTQPNDWMRAEGRYIARLFRGPLAWFGITDLAFAPDGRLLAFRLTPLADWFLHDLTPSQQVYQQQKKKAASSLEVQENGDILLDCTAECWPLMKVIEDFVEVAGIRRGQLRYRLTPKSLSEALSRGKRPTALVDILRSLAEQEAQLNSPLARLLAQIEQLTANYGRARLYTGVSLLEVADTLVLRELSATTSVQEQIMQHISPTLMILNTADEERFVEELKRRGHTPLLHEKDG